MDELKRIVDLEKRVAALEMQLQEQPKAIVNNLVITAEKKRTVSLQELQFLVSL